MHDKTFHRITAERRRHEVNQMTLEEITNIDAGSWFNEKFSDQRILTLKEFLTLPKGPIGMMLDIKKETVTECDLANVVGDVIKKVKTPGSIIAGSLNPDILLCLEAYLPQQSFIPIIPSISMFNEFNLENAVENDL